MSWRERLRVGYLLLALPVVAIAVGDIGGGHDSAWVLDAASKQWRMEHWWLDVALTLVLYAILYSAPLVYPYVITKATCRAGLRFLDSRGVDVQSVSERTIGALAFLIAIGCGGTFLLFLTNIAVFLASLSSDRVVGWFVGMAVWAFMVFHAITDEAINIRRRPSDRS